MQNRLVHFRQTISCNYLIINARAETHKKKTSRGERVRSEATQGVWGDSAPSKPKVKGTKKATAGMQSPFRVPLTVVFSNLLLEGIERLWEVHKILPNPKHFPLAAEDSVS